MSTYVFPEKLRSEGHAYMSIDILDDGTKIYLYTPPGLSFQDGASYGQLNLGAIGAELAGSDATTMLEKLKGMSTGDMINSTITAAQNTVENATGSIIAGILNQSKAVQGLNMNGSLASAKEIYSYGAKKVLNPYSTTAFNSSQARSYQFAFKFIASNAKESMMIRDMLADIRSAMYPKENGKLILKYPSRFRIKFFTGASAAGGDRESEYIPAMYDCYMTNLQVTYNTTSNVYFEDGSPAEVDVSLSFQETKVLTANDIDELDSVKVRSIAQKENFVKTTNAVDRIKKGIMGGL